MRARTAMRPGWILPAAEPHSTRAHNNVKIRPETPREMRKYRQPAPENPANLSHKSRNSCARSAPRAPHASSSTQSTRCKMCRIQPGRRRGRRLRRFALACEKRDHPSRNLPPSPKRLDIYSEHPVAKCAKSPHARRTAGQESPILPESHTSPTEQSFPKLSAIASSRRTLL